MDLNEMCARLRAQFIADFEAACSDPAVRAVDWCEIGLGNARSLGRLARLGVRADEMWTWVEAVRSRPGNYWVGHREHERLFRPLLAWHHAGFNAYEALACRRAGVGLSEAVRIVARDEEGRVTPETLASLETLAALL